MFSLSLNLKVKQMQYSGPRGPTRPQSAKNQYQCLENQQILTQALQYGHRHFPGFW